MKLSELKKFVDSALQDRGDMVVALATDIECNSMHHIDGEPWVEDLGNGPMFCLAPDSHGEELASFSTSSN